MRDAFRTKLGHNWTGGVGSDRVNNVVDGGLKSVLDGLNEAAWMPGEVA